MVSRIGTPIPRKFVISIYPCIAGGLGLVTLVVGIADRDWKPAAFFFGIAAILLVLPNIRPRQREFVQVDDEGVAVATKEVIERISWSEIERVRILTTNEGPWVEDVYFLLEAAHGKGCAVPHEAAVRTRLLEELQSRLPGFKDDKVIEAMGCTDNSSFTIWEKSAASAG